MKLKIIANNQGKWNWNKKLKELQAWFPSLEIELLHSNFKDIPFVEFEKGNKEVPEAWLRKNLPLNADIILFSIPTKQWKGGGVTGRCHHGTPEILQIGADEFGKYYFGSKSYPGGRWYNLARHEIHHAMYKILGKVDKTHYYWELGEFEKSRQELLGSPQSAVNHILMAMDYLGVKEFVGKENNPIILKWAMELGLPYYSDETPWCSLFVNYICKKSGLPYTGKLNARSWLDIGKKVTVPKSGDICVFWRNHPQSWEGHVGFYMTGDDKNIAVLGGNQGDKVSTAIYKKSQLLAFIRLT